jgi:hypothetical protein
MIIHAAGESAFNAQTQANKAKTPPGVGIAITAVALASPNEEKLLALESKLQFEGIDHVAFREPDAPWNGALMSVGILVDDRRAVRRFLKPFRMIGE